MHRRSSSERDMTPFSPAPGAKWGARIATNPFGAFASAAGGDEQASSDAESEWKDSAAFLQEVDESNNNSSNVSSAFGFVHGKENLTPSRRNIHIYGRSAAAVTTTPRSKTAIRSDIVRPPRAPPTPTTRLFMPSPSPSKEKFSVLGKRQHAWTGQARIPSPSKRFPRRASKSDSPSIAGSETGQIDGDMSSQVTEHVTLVVNDFNTVPQLNFGKVPIGDRKSLQLTLHNPSVLGNARIKYEGYSLVHKESGHRQPSEKLRFKCDLHVCVVPAESSVLLRITFEPTDEDLERDVTALMRFTVNDRYKVQCRVSGAAVARALKVSRFRGRGAFAPMGQGAPNATLDQIVESQVVNKETKSVENDRKQIVTSGKVVLHNAQSRFESKKREALVFDMTPTRKRKVKRLRSEDANDGGTPNKLVPASSKKLSDSATQSAGGANSFVGSWWSQRKIVYDEHWMVKQEEGFTKWMNYVLVDSNAQRFMEEEEIQAQDDERNNGQKRRRTKRKFDFSSLRILAQTRMESSWTRSAYDIYHSPAMDDILFDLQEEISKKKLSSRGDRPVYADVGLQEELIALLNNYHPVWLRLGLEAVLGQKVMKDERCSLRSMFSIPAKKNSKPTKMPRALRRIILHHLVHDLQVARKFRLVKNLRTPIDGSLNVSDAGSGRAAKNYFVNKKKNITGREYFDALMDSFILKFLMLIKFLDTAVGYRVDKFMHFPCLFRVSPVSAGKKSQDCSEDEKKIKSSQRMVAEFCRLFLSSEGRIDKHLKQLGYVLTHQQTPLDEIDVEIKNLAVDLRDGVRLAKLMEALTSSTQSNEAATKPLSSYLRVPALSRLQKVHNVEICLHYLEEKCGQDVLESIKSATNVTVHLNKKVTGSSGFASLQNQVDEKLVEKIAKEIVDGHREKTLALCWKLISCFQLQSLVDVDAVRDEIDYIQNRMSFRAAEFLEREQKNSPLEGLTAEATEDQVYGLLLEWCRVVCANYFLEVKDFTSSFADGKVLCYLLHYYHPMLLSKTDILPTTSDLAGNEQVNNVEELLSNEKQNFTIVNERVKQLGEIPVLVPQHYHSQNPPEEKMVVTFVCYLQSRLMDSSKEIHAASRLKRWWLSPWIRTQMRIKKNRSARIIQRFWFTSSQKRLAIRQCRRLLRAAHVVKSVMMMWSKRVQFTRLRSAVIVVQRAFRFKWLESSDHKHRWQQAALLIQRQWRSHVKWRIKKEQLEIEAARARIARRLRMKSSCGVIENCWVQYANRRKARAMRQKLLLTQHYAATKLQMFWQSHRRRQEAKAFRSVVWKREHRSAAVIQAAWRTYQRRAALFQRIRVHMCAQKVKNVLRLNMINRKMERAVALERFQRMLKDQEMEKKRQDMKKRVENRAAACIQVGYKAYSSWKRRTCAAVTIQSAFRCFLQRKRFQYEYARVIQLQRNFRIWRRNNQVKALLRFERLLSMHKREQSARQAEAATKIQSLFRCFAQQRRYHHVLFRTIQLQRNVRIWRRQRQVKALIQFYGMLIMYQQMQEDERERSIATVRIQSAFRGYAQRKRVFFQYSQIVKLQRNIRIWRRNRQVMALFRFNRMLASYQRQKYERLRILHWKVEDRAARTIQQRFRSFIRRRREASAVCIQARVRGWFVRARKFNYYAMQEQLARLRVFYSCWKIEHWFVDKMERYKKRKALTTKARWVQLAAGVLWRKRANDANRIAACWRSYRFRCMIFDKLIQRREERLRAQQQMAAATVQRWWIRLCWKWEGRRMIAKEKKRQRAIAEAEEAKRQAMIRAQREAALAEEAKRQGLLRRRDQATVVVSKWMIRRVLMPLRSERKVMVSVVKIQSWWRGMLVRLHHSDADVTSQRKKLSTMTLVSSAPLAVPASKDIMQQEPPLTLGARLEMALHLLLHGKRLQEMLFASHTIEVCTKYSRECCRKCVKLGIPKTIFAAIRGLNRSRPHVELLHQLLLVLVNLMNYQLWERSSALSGSRLEKSAESVLDDARAIEALVDLMHIHRDMQQVFVPSARVLKHYVTELVLHKRAFEPSSSAMEIWRDAERRLQGLHDLLEKKMAIYALMSRSLQTPSKGTSLTSRMNPKTGVSILSQLLKMVADE
ncbi:Abnormal spindle-like microcephaly-associated protein, partial [Globisporangium splendens]